MPDESCPWQDILDFKAESYDQQWDFRRFLHALASKQQAEAEIKDDIDWTINQYRRAMQRYELKASESFVSVFLVPAVGVIENLLKLNFSAILKGVLSVRQRKVELLDAEANAKGRECAYVFEARKRFGGE